MVDDYDTLEQQDKKTNEKKINFQAKVMPEVRAKLHEIESDTAYKELQMRFDEEIEEFKEQLHTAKSNQAKANEMVQEFEEENRRLEEELESKKDTIADKDKMNSVQEATIASQKEHINQLQAPGFCTKVSCRRDVTFGI